MSHGYHETEIKIEMHGFDPLKTESARKYINIFTDAKNAPAGIWQTDPFAFYLNRSVLEELLSETRNGIEFNVLNVDFGLDADNQFVLLITRGNGNRNIGGYEEYVTVPQYYRSSIAENGPIVNMYEPVEYAILITKNTKNINVENRINVNGPEYLTLISRYRERFDTKKLHPEGYVKVSAKKVSSQLNISANSYILIPIDTFSSGYHIGKGVLRTIWQIDGKWEGVKVFLGYGPINRFTSVSNVHLIAIGTENPHLVVDPKFNGPIWATVNGSNIPTGSHSFDGTSTCVRSRPQT